MLPSKSKSLVSTFPETGMFTKVVLISSIAFVVLGSGVIVQSGVPQGVQVTQGVGSEEVSVTFGPTGGVPVAVAKFSTCPAAKSAAVIA